MSATDIVWFRRDARLDDNPAWVAGSEASSVCALFVIDPILFESATERRRAHLIGGLVELDRRLAEGGGRLRVEYGKPEEVVPSIANELGARAVHVNREVTPYGVARDERVADEVELTNWDGHYVHAPGSILTQSETTYRVFTPFFNNWKQRPVDPHSSPNASGILTDSGEGLPEMKTPSVGEAHASGLLEEFLDDVDDYVDLRDRPDLDATSHLSIALKYGWVGPRTVVDRVGTASTGRQQFVRQIAWRDFWGHLLSAHPETVDTPMHEKYSSIEWRDDGAGLAAWQSGMTGYPIIDAGMRQLESQGWIHNRVRMLVASFLVKDLLIDWRVGERYLRRHLLDADVAQNVGNWQWVAGTGADAAPYFRVMNPTTQSEKFDPRGEYIGRWVPELAGLPDNLVHEPASGSDEELETHGVVLGQDYPEPIVDHLMARQRAIDAYKSAAG